MECYNCVAQHNTYASFSAGFAVDGNDNRVILVGCKSYEDRNAFSCATGSMITLIDCGYLNQVNSVYYGNGTFEKLKFNVVEPS